MPELVEDLDVVEEGVLLSVDVVDTDGELVQESADVIL